MSIISKLANINHNSLTVQMLLAILDHFTTNNAGTKIPYRHTYL